MKRALLPLVVQIQKRPASRKREGGVLLLRALSASWHLKLRAPRVPWQGFAAPIVTLAVLLFSLMPVQGQPSSFLEAFDGNPGVPLPWRPEHWDVSYGSQQPSGSLVTDPMDAHHGPGCEPPLVDPALPFNLLTNPLVTHPISRNPDTVFICRDHLMTAIRGDSYAAIYLTPNQLVDFSQGPAVVRFEMSTFRQSSRDWVDFVLQPWDSNLQLNFQGGSTPRDAVHIEMINQIGLDRFRPTVIRDHVTRSVAWNDVGYPPRFVTSPAQRSVFELRISRDRLSFCMPDHAHCWVNNALIDPPLTWDQAILQFNHRSYNPLKDDAAGCAVVGHCGPGTWHWDSVSINPAREFSMIRATRELADANAPELQFLHPAPSGAMLHFSARTSTQLGQHLEVSFDGGSRWQEAIRQVDSNPPGDEWFKSYWMPVPADVQRVQFRRADRQAGWRVRDAAFWSLSAGGDPTPTVGTVDTPQPTSTPSPEPPTATPTPSPEATAGTTPEPTAISTRTPTPGSTLPPTPEPTMTPTVVPCFLAVWRLEELLRGSLVACP